MSPEAIRHHPAPKDIQQAKSLHVFAFSLQGELLLNESEGSFDMDEWENAYDVAEGVCIKTGEGMEREEQTNLEQWMRGVVGEKVAKEQRWRS